MRRSAARMQVSTDRCFEEVVRRCADPDRPHGWITEGFVEAYTRLHELGWAHSVETWLDGELVGGLYGVRIGALFAGESMFHVARDASKVALMHLAGRMAGEPAALLDVQWQTTHLATLGAVEIRRSRYLELLGAALRRDLPDLRAYHRPSSPPREAGPPIS